LKTPCLEKPQRETGDGKLSRRSVFEGRTYMRKNSTKGNERTLHQMDGKRLVLREIPAPGNLLLEEPSRGA